MSRETCCDCAKRFDPDTPGACKEVVTWVRKRGRGTGGTNATIKPRETGRHRCPDCSKLRQLGVIPGQTEMFA